MKNVSCLLIILFYSVQSLTAQSSTQLKSWLPAIEGWSIDEKVEVFDADNLFDRINGAAPLFIENNFREMTSMEYIRGKDYITIQAYRHATPEDAFGMYASERSSGLNYFPIGGEAQGDDANFYFFSGNIYIKMWSSSTENVGQTLRTIADGLARNIDPEASYPSIINAFPKAGIIPYTTAYITSNYIGHEFLKGVYTTQYKSEDKTFQLFVIDAGEKEEAKKVLERYFTFTKQPLDFQEGELTIKDRYNGDIPVRWKSRYIIGAFSENGEEIKNSNQILEEVSDNLTR